MGQWGQLGDVCRYSYISQQPSLPPRPPADLTCPPASPDCAECLWGRPFQENPVKVMEGIKAVAAGIAHSVFLNKNGSVFASGWNDRGQLGDGTVTSRRHPVLVMTGVRSIAAGSSHTLFLMDDGNGTVYATGANGNGQLGDGSREDRRRPVLVQSGVESMVAGVSQSLFLMADKTVVATD